MSHRIHDEVGLELARRIADGLDHHPEWLELARENLRRWRDKNVNAPGLLRCYAEWAELLDKPIGAIRQVLLDPGHEGQRLRQSSPFAGVLSPREVWAIKRQVRGEIDHGKAITARSEGSAGSGP